MQHIVSLSGGKDSTAMLLMMLEKNMRVDRVLNIDTTKEFPEMYKHLRKLQRYICIEIETIKINFDYFFGEHLKIKGKNKGKAGYGWCDFRNRWCTGLKLKALSFLEAREEYNPLNQVTCKKKIEKTSYIGIAIDEPKRIKSNEFQKTNNILKYPLAEWGVTEKEALQYCYDKGFDWGGLYDEGRSRVSCYCCPLQRIKELRLTYDNHPELWQKMLEMDKYSYRDFRHKKSLGDLTYRFKHEVVQGTLF